MGKITTSLDKIEGPRVWGVRYGSSQKKHIDQEAPFMDLGQTGSGKGLTESTEVSMNPLVTHPGNAIQEGHRENSTCEVEFYRSQRNR
jgi:hypothetical protein